MSNNTPRQIRERREKILMLMTKGYNQTRIADELGISTRTIIRDMKYINEMTHRGLFDMARKTFATMYTDCVEGCSELLLRCWEMIDNPNNNPTINNWHKLAAMRLANDIYHHKFTMFQNGPATMELGHLWEQVEDLRRFALDDKGTFTKRLPSLSSWHSPSLPSPSPPNKTYDIPDLDKPLCY